MDLENWTYPYGLRKGTALFLLAAAALVIYFGYDETFHDNRGLILWHVIEFGPFGARVFWACFALLGVTLLLATLRGVYLNLTGERSVVLRQRAVTLPRHRFSSREVTIPYRDILELRLTSYRGQKYFTVRTSDQKIIVQNVFLPTNESFTELYEELGTRVRRAERAHAGFA